MKSWIKDKFDEIIDDLSRAHKSLTIWFNALCGSLMLFLPDAIQSFPQIQPYVPDAVFKHGMAILLVGNLLLRFKTDSALRDK